MDELEYEMGRMYCDNVCPECQLQVVVSVLPFLLRLVAGAMRFVSVVA